MIGGSGLQWAGIRELLETELRAFTHASRNISLEGPPVALRADVAPLLALMFHELVSNAVKYGALSDVGEGLEISWKEEAGGLEIHWNEKLKTVLDVPTRRGFGMTLIERSVPHECNGTCDIRFTKTGLRVKFWLPNDAIRTGEGSPQAAKVAPTVPIKSNSLPKHGTSIIVVEDNTLLAIEMESLLDSHGYQNVRVFNGIESCEGSVFEHGDELPDIAILDINLGKSTSFDLGQKLQEHGVSLIIVSGYDDGFEPPACLADVPRLRKPVDDDELIQTIFNVEELRK